MDRFIHVGTFGHYDVYVDRRGQHWYWESIPQGWGFTRMNLRSFKEDHIYTSRFLKRVLAFWIRLTYE